MSSNIPAITSELDAKVKAAFSEILDPAVSLASELAFLGFDYPVGGDTLYITQRNGMNLFPIPTDPEILRIRLPKWTKVGNLIVALHACPPLAALAQSARFPKTRRSEMSEFREPMIEKTIKIFLKALRETRTGELQSWFQKTFDTVTSEAQMDHPKSEGSPKTGLNTSIDIAADWRNTPAAVVSPQQEGTSMNTREANPAWSADAVVYHWRNALNRMTPCILAATDFLGDRIETFTDFREPVAGAIRLDFTKDSRPITPANLAASLGLNSVRAAAERLVDIAAGRSVSGDAGNSCSTIATAVFCQAGQYPLDRPDLRLPHERGPS